MAPACLDASFRDHDVLAQRVAFSCFRLEGQLVLRGRIALEAAPLVLLLGVLDSQRGGMAEARFGLAAARVRLAVAHLSLLSAVTPLVVRNAQHCDVLAERVAGVALAAQLDRVFGRLVNVLFGFLDSVLRRIGEAHIGVAFPAAIVIHLRLLIGSCALTLTRSARLRQRCPYARRSLWPVRRAGGPLRP